MPAYYSADAPPKGHLFMNPKSSTPEIPPPILEQVLTLAPPAPFAKKRPNPISFFSRNVRHLKATTTTRRLHITVISLNYFSLLTEFASSFAASRAKINLEKPRTWPSRILTVSRSLICPSVTIFGAFWIKTRWG